MAPIFRLIAICPIALWMAGCAPNTDTAHAGAGAGAVGGAGTAIDVTTQEQITVTDGIRTREVHEVRNGIREIILQENQKAGQLHGEQRRFAKGMLIEEVHYENGKQTEVKDQAWLDEMNELRAENCVLEKIPDHPDPETKEPPMSPAMRDQVIARCNERPFASDK
jgi:hypothetical protein